MRNWRFGFCGKTPYWCLCVSLVALSPWANGNAVEERHGNIYFRSGNGKLKQVTSSGADRSAALSPDGTRIVFVRNLGARDLGSGVGDAVGPEFGPSQLWTYDTRGGKPPELLLDSPIEVEGRRFFGFYGPEFSSSNDAIDFQIDFAATSGAVVRVTVATKTVVFVTQAITFAVIPIGRYRDHLIVQQRRPKLGLGYYNWFYLMNPDGKEVGVIGEDRFDVSNFLDTNVGDVSSCPRWNGPEWMSCINQIRYTGRALAKP